MPILVDIIMIGLLVGVIIHSARLSQSLTNFKSLHSEMLPMMKDYAKTLIDTQTQINELKKVSKEVDHIINSRIPPALMVKNDLDFLVGRANELADHLETLVSQGRLQEFAVLNKTLSEDLPKTSSREVSSQTVLTPKLRASQEDKLETPFEEETLEDPAIKKKPTIESFFSTKTLKKIASKGRMNAI